MNHYRCIFYSRFPKNGRERLRYRITEYVLPAKSAKAARLAASVKFRALLPEVNARHLTVMVVRARMNGEAA